MIIGMVLLSLFIVGGMVAFLTGSPSPEQATSGQAGGARVNQQSASSGSGQQAGPSARPITVDTAASLTRVHEIVEGTVGPSRYSPDGQWLVIAMGTKMVLYDATTMEMVRTLRGSHQNPINSLDFSPAPMGQAMLLISSAINEPWVQVWNVQNGQPVRKLGGHTGWIRSLAFSPDGKLIATGSTDLTINLWNAHDGTLLRTLKGHTDMVSHVTFSPDSSRLASTARDGSVRLWDVSRGAEVRDGSIPQPFLQMPTDPATGSPFWTTAAVFSPDGSMLAIGSTDTNVRVLSTSDSSMLHTFDTHRTLIVIRGLEFSPDGTMLASASVDGEVRLWDPRTGAERISFQHQADQTAGISWHPDGTKLVTSSDRLGTVLVWNTSNGTVAERLSLAHGPAIGLSYSSLGRILGSSGENGVIRLSVLDEDKYIMLSDAAPTHQPMAFVSDVDLAVATSTHDPGSVVLFDLTRSRQPQTLTNLTGQVQSVVVSPDLNRIAMGSSKGELQLWDLRRTELLRTLQGLDGGITFLASGDGGKLLAGSNDAGSASGGGTPTIAIWDAESGTLQHRLTGHSDTITGLAMQPWGSTLASISSDGTLRLWNGSDGTRIRTIETSDSYGGYTSIAFSPDGTLLVAGHVAGVITFHNAETGETVHTIKTHGSRVLALAFHPEGKQLAASLERGGIRLFEVR